MKKGNKTGLWIALAALGMCFCLLLAGSVGGYFWWSGRSHSGKPSAAVSSKPEGPEVEFEITGKGVDKAEVVSDGQILGAVSLPWKQTKQAEMSTAVPGEPSANLRAEGWSAAYGDEKAVVDPSAVQNQSLTCRVTFEGKVIAEITDFGDFPAVSCGTGYFRKELIKASFEVTGSSEFDSIDIFWLDAIRSGNYHRYRLPWRREVYLEKRNDGSLPYSKITIGGAYDAAGERVYEKSVTCRIFIDGQLADEGISGHAEFGKKGPNYKSICGNTR